MAKYNLGVTVENVVEIKRIDTDFFEEQQVKLYLYLTRTGAYSDWLIFTTVFGKVLHQQLALFYYSVWRFIDFRYIASNASSSENFCYTLHKRSITGSKMLSTAKSQMNCTATSRIGLLPKGACICSFPSCDGGVSYICGIIIPRF